MNYRIGTRGSKLALVQTAFVRERLAAAYPADTFEIVTICTRGDVVTDRPIAAIGDNALFTREIEAALLDGRIDLAVHSMKDLPATCAEGLSLARAWSREDPRDVLILRDGAGSLADLPSGATVATGSPRRTLLLRRLRPDLKLVDIRGNVDTRLRKLFEPTADEPRLDGLVLAAAGLKRLGRAEVISEWLDPTVMIPAANQGTLAIELRAADVALKTKVDALGTDADETVAVAERTFLREIGADCHMPIGAFARLENAAGESANPRRGLELRAVFARDVSEEPAIVAVCGSDPTEVAFRAAVEVRRRLAGHVTLVGAGPGDPELITVRGLEAIRRADAIVYDRLASEELLTHAKPGCELVYAGKASGNHALPQDEINATLVRLAMAHAQVVRLKGGDPFVFGRGGEEMAYLVERGVGCSVVPGVTSAIAAAASVGIPVTHRGVASGFEVVTAHAKDDTPLMLDFTRFRDSSRTYVFLMGLARIGELAEGLIAAGRSPDTPAAVIGAATTSARKSAIGTLADIAAKVARAEIVSPAVLVVGEVVRLHGEMGFPLVGRRVLVPEIGGGSRTAEVLRALGADVESVEVGRIEAIPGALSAERLAGVTWLVFTSRNGLLPFEALAKPRPSGEARTPPLRRCGVSPHQDEGFASTSFDSALVEVVRRCGIRVAAIGQATAAAVREKGLEIDFVATKATGEDLLAELRERLTPTDVVLHPTAEGARSALAGLSCVCRYETVAVYRNVEVAIDRPIDLGRYDAAFFTCASSARRTYARATGETLAVAIGPATRAALEALGVPRIVTAACPTPESMAAVAI